MIPAASLTNRIFLASALLVAASTGLAIYRVSVSVGARAEDELHDGLAEAASLVDELSRTQFNDFAIKGSLIADLPVLKGAASTDHPPTVQPIAEDYQRRAHEQRDAGQREQAVEERGAARAQAQGGERQRDGAGQPERGQRQGLHGRAVVSDGGGPDAGRTQPIVGGDHLERDFHVEHARAADNGRDVPRAFEREVGAGAEEGVGRAWPCSAQEDALAG